MKPRADHVFVKNVGTGYEMSCANCGEKHLIDQLPMRMEFFIGTAKAFGKAHRNCKPKPVTGEGRREPTLKGGVPVPGGIGVMEGEKCLFGSFHGILKRGVDG